MKILLIAENPAGPFGGIERHCYNICKMFYTSEVEVQMASTELFLISVFLKRNH